MKHQVKSISVLVFLSVILALAGCQNKAADKNVLTGKKSAVPADIPQAPSPGQSQKDFYIAQQKARFENNNQSNNH